MHISVRLRPASAAILAERSQARAAQTERSHAIRVGLFCLGGANKPACGQELPSRDKLRSKPQICSPDVYISHPFQEQDQGKDSSLECQQQTTVTTDLMRLTLLLDR